MENTKTISEELLTLVFTGGFSAGIMVFKDLTADITHMSSEEVVKLINSKAAEAFKEWSEMVNTQTPSEDKAMTKEDKKKRDALLKALLGGRKE